MRKLSHDEISLSRHTQEELEPLKRTPVYVLLDSIRSLYNVGSIFRTSDGARISELYLCGYTPHPPRKEIDKTALGATKTVPWKYFENTSDALDILRNKGVRICVLEHTDQSVSYSALTKADFPLCLVVGNEITGVSKEIVTRADMAIEIPMFGMKQSLNVAVAYGIAVFEMVRIWNEAR